MRAGLEVGERRSRWPWLLLPWMAAALTPAGLEMARHPVGAALGAGEDEWRGSWPGRRTARPAATRLRCGSTKMTRWRTRSTVVAGGVTETCSGIVQQLGGQLADLLRHGGREEQVLALLAAACATIRRIGAMKPRSSIWSASSSTRISVPSRRDGALVEVVEQAAGRGDQHVDAAARALDLRRRTSTPPKMTATVSPCGGRRCGSCRRSGWPVRASGDSTSTRQPLRGAGSRGRRRGGAGSAARRRRSCRCRSGRCPCRSRPAITLGMAWAWIGVGVV